MHSLSFRSSATSANRDGYNDAPDRSSCRLEVNEDVLLDSGTAETGVAKAVLKSRGDTGDDS